LLIFILMMTNDTINFNNPEFIQYLKDNHALAIEILHNQFLENKQENIQDACVICLTEEATERCDAGDHYFACEDCFNLLKMGDDDRCPVCRHPYIIPLIRDEPEPPSPPPVEDWSPTVIYPLFSSLGDINDLSRRLVRYLSGDNVFRNDGEQRQAYEYLLTQPFPLLKECLSKEATLYIFVERNSETDENPCLWFGLLVTINRILIMKDLNEFHKNHLDRTYSFYKRKKTLMKYYHPLITDGVKGYFTPTKHRKVNLVMMSKRNTEGRDLNYTWPIYN